MGTCLPGTPYMCLQLKTPCYYWLGFLGPFLTASLEDSSLMLIQWLFHNTQGRPLWFYLVPPFIIHVFIGSYTVIYVLVYWSNRSDVCHKNVCLVTGHKNSSWRPLPTKVTSFAILTPHIVFQDSLLNLLSQMFIFLGVM